MFKFLLSVFLLTACQMPMKDGDLMSVDAYVRKIPDAKKAVLRLENKDVTDKDLEVVTLIDGLRPVLSEKGYTLVSKAEAHDIVLNLFFAVRQNGSWAGKYSFDSGDAPSMPYGENDTYRADMTTLYFRNKVYKKILRMTAADKNGNQFWKISVEKEDEKDDFRSAQEQLLYLFAKFVEKDSRFRITGRLTRSEFGQRKRKGLSAAESAESYYAPAENRNDYERHLQNKINANAAAFRACGLNGKTQFYFDVSAFGTLPSFNPLTLAGIKTLTSEQADCVAKAIEPMLEPPEGVETPLNVSIFLPSE